MTRLKNDNCKFSESGKCKLTVSTQKRKGKVEGHAGLDKHDVNSVQVESGSVEVVNHFAYFGLAFRLQHC